MNWKKSPPKTPGAYWWRAASGVVKCCEVFTDRDGNQIAQGFGVSDDVDLLKGEWCGPLVPEHRLLDIKAAAQAHLDRYVALVNSGDAGNWNPEEDDHVINLRRALNQ